MDSFKGDDRAADGIPVEVKLDNGGYFEAFLMNIINGEALIHFPCGWMPESKYQFSHIRFPPPEETQRSDLQEKMIAEVLVNKNQGCHEGWFKCSIQMLKSEFCQFEYLDAQNGCDFGYTCNMRKPNINPKLSMEMLHVYKMLIPEDLREYAKGEDVHRTLKDAMKSALVNYDADRGELVIISRNPADISRAEILKDVHLKSLSQESRYLQFRGKLNPKLEIAKSSGFSAEFTVPESYLGLAIGNGKVHLRAAQKIKGISNVQLIRATNKFVIHGNTEEAVNDARELLEIKIEPYPILEEYMSQLVGRESANIHKIIQATGAVEIIIEDFKDGLEEKKKGKDLPVYIIGSAQAIEKAKIFFQFQIDHILEVKRLREEKLEINRQIAMFVRTDRTPESILSTRFETVPSTRKSTKSDLVELEELQNLTELLSEDFEEPIDLDASLETTDINLEDINTEDLDLGDTTRDINKENFDLEYNTPRDISIENTTTTNDINLEDINEKNVNEENFDLNIFRNLSDIESTATDISLNNINEDYLDRGDNIMEDNNLKNITADNDLENIRTEVDLENITTEVDLENITTEVDLENITTEVDLENITTEVDLENIKTEVVLKNITTKVDLENITTEIDLENIKTEVVLKNITTKVDLENITTEVDLENITTKVDLKNITTEVDLENITTDINLGDINVEELDLEDNSTRLNVSMESNEDSSKTIDTAITISNPENLPGLLYGVQYCGYYVMPPKEVETIENVESAEMQFVEDPDFWNCDVDNTPLKSLLEKQDTTSSNLIKEQVVEEIDKVISEAETYTEQIHETDLQDENLYLEASSSTPKYHSGGENLTKKPIVTPRLSLLKKSKKFRNVSTETDDMIGLSSASSSEKKFIFSKSEMSFLCDKEILVKIGNTVFSAYLKDLHETGSREERIEAQCNYQESDSSLPVEDALNDLDRSCASEDVGFMEQDSSVHSKSE